MGSKESGFRRSENIKSEIEYRRRLTEQHLGLGHHFDDHKDSLDEVFPSWIEQQIRWFDYLLPKLERESAIGRFLEVGAEKGHIGIHVRNQYGIAGVCTDLSHDTFRMATPVVQKRMEAPHRPSLVSADVHALPFKDDAFDLVYCFSALHHFYSPDDALEEIRRVLQRDGVFFCAWEPMVPLFRTKPLPNSEVEFGVYENTYTSSQYRTMLRRHFRRVETVFAKDAPSAYRRQDTGVKSFARRFVPPWIIRMRQVVLRGSGNFTAICWMD